MNVHQFVSNLNLAAVSPMSTLSLHLYGWIFAKELGGGGKMMTI